MARTATLRQRNGYWISYRNGKATYFGKVADTPHAEALRRFQDHVGGGGQDHAPPAPMPTVDALADRFLAWVLEHRGKEAHEQRSIHLRRFRDSHGEVPADAIGGSHCEAFIASLRKAGYAPDYIHKHLISIGAMFNKGVRKGWIPPTVRPFASVEPIRRPSATLTEDKLMTDAEVKALLAFADADLTTVGTGRGSRRRQPHEYRSGDGNPWRGFGELLRVYHATGARTSELLHARVRDFQPTSRQIVLGSHKRSHTLKTPTPRTIALNADAYAIVARRCEGRAPDAHIFTQPRSNRPWNRFSVAERFKGIRERAGVRDAITIYSFRHLWISEMLMAGVDAMLIARMAGTSVKMIETVYGHFRTQSYTDAQARLDAMRGQGRGE